MSNENLYSSELFQSAVMTKSYYQVLQDSNLIESQVLQPLSYQLATSQYMTQSNYIKPKSQDQRVELLHQLDEEHDSEDEGIEDYKMGGYHPVHVGEVLANRYVIIQKLGWGHFSTVWLSKDFKYNTYVAIKVQKSAENYLEAAYDEVEILQKVAQEVHNKSWIEKLKHYKANQPLTRDDSHVVQLLNSFVHRAPYGSHFCMVFEILGVNLLEIIKRYEFKGVPVNLCKKIAKEVLIGLEFLHDVCGVIHTDLKPENVLLQLTQEEISDIIENGQLTKNQIFKERLDFYHKLFNIKQENPVDNQNIVSCQEIKNEEIIEKTENQQQTQQLTKTQLRNKQRREKKKKEKLLKQENIQTDFKEQEIKIQKNLENIKNNQDSYNNQNEESQKRIFQIDSEKINFKKQKNEFSVKVADLGNACWTHHQFSTLIQTRQYRSPEVLLGVKYNQTADMWSFACMLFELLTGEFLFEPRKGANFSKNDDHLAQIQELMGAFPKQFCLRGLKSKRYFNKQGTLHRIPNLNFWSIYDVLTEKYKFKPDEARELTSFLEPMLNPFPEKRATAAQSLKHGWLQTKECEYRMTEEEYKFYKENKQNLQTSKICETSNTTTADSDNQSPELKELIEKWKKERYQNVSKNYRRIEGRVVKRNEIDRSFTDLGYIGFGEGIDVEYLDSTGNWQFMS